MKAKINKRFLATISVPESGEDRYYDEDFSNFVLVVYPSGRRRYFYFYSFLGKRRQDKLPGDIAPLKAKEWARAIQARLAMGEDPREGSQKEQYVTVSTDSGNSPVVVENEEKYDVEVNFLTSIVGNQATFIDLAEVFETKIFPTYRNPTTVGNYRRNIERLILYRFITL